LVAYQVLTACGLYIFNKLVAGKTDRHGNEPVTTPPMVLGNIAKNLVDANRGPGG